MIKQFRISFLIIAGALLSPSFSISKQNDVDSLSLWIQAEMSKYQSRYYYASPDSLSYYFDALKDTASIYDQWDWVVYLTTIEAQAFGHAQEFDRVDKILDDADLIFQQHKALLDSIDKTREAEKSLLFTKGSHYFSLGRFTQSISQFNKLLQIDKSLPSLGVGYLYSIHSYLGSSYAKLLLFDKAVQHYNHAYRNIEGIPEAYRGYYEALYFSYLGGIYRQEAVFSGNDSLLNTALDNYQNGLEVMLADQNSQNYRPAIISIYRSVADIFKLQQKFDSALYYNNKALGWQTQNDGLLVKTLLEGGDIHLKNNDYKKATEFFTRSLKVSNEVFSYQHYSKGEAYTKLAQLKFEKNDLDSALYYVELADRILSQGSNSSYFTKALVPIELKGEILTKKFLKTNNQQNLQQAATEFQKGLEMVRQVERDFPGSAYKLFFKSYLNNFYESALESLYLLVKSEPSIENASIYYEFIEANKSSLLRESLKNEGALLYAGVPNSVLLQETQLKSAIGKLHEKITDSPQDSALHEELFIHQNQLDSLVDEVEKNYPEYYQLKYAAQSWDVNELQKSIKPGQKVLIYFWGDSSLFTLAVDRDNFSVDRIELSTDLTESVSEITEYCTSIDKNSVQSYSKNAYKIYQKVVEPYLAESVQKLTIVADGPLIYIPFDALVTDATEVNEFHQMPYLIKEVNISHMLSSNLSGKTVDPRFEYSYLGIAPKYDQTFLKYSKSEVLAAAAIWSNSKVLLEEAAVKSSFLDFAPKAGLLHLAAHTKINEEESLLSHFILNDSLGQEAPLHFYEIYNMRNNSGLAVLSGCETGAGKYARGEGIMSLGSAFQYAGCSNIIMSLWQVNDMTTTAIMENLFNNLKQGQPKDEALRRAKLSFLSEPKNKFFHHPYYWSAFVLYGDQEPLQGNTNKQWIVLAAGGLLLVLFSLFFYRKFSQK
ncbi:CHAT domain-containing protein [Fulvivirga sp. RKSG066]|uniref:CHAT domain-containing protein n=1 Tax=Fulvivirga aurantia TaxID=2529383 RepID=UPI0012BBBD1C|nr:CHAT domain-containing protein [Fulvivirga aurantia]MTI22635.1 CHAT domain-containing protein [Fulvivirga aurantia]